MQPKMILLLWLYHIYKYLLIQIIIINERKIVRLSRGASLDPFSVIKHELFPFQLS